MKIKIKGQKSIKILNIIGYNYTVSVEAFSLVCICQVSFVTQNTEDFLNAFHNQTQIKVRGQKYHIIDIKNECIHDHKTTILTLTPTQNQVNELYREFSGGHC